MSRVYNRTQPFFLVLRGAPRGVRLALLLPVCAFRAFTARSRVIQAWGGERRRTRVGGKRGVRRAAGHRDVGLRSARRLTSSTLERVLAEVSRYSAPHWFSHERMRRVGEEKMLLRRAQKMQHAGQGTAKQLDAPWLPGTAPPPWSPHARSPCQTCCRRAGWASCPCRAPGSPGRGSRSCVQTKNAP
jgi:hypothetical protein